MSAHLLAAVADPRSVYTLSTPELEQLLAATTGITHGRKSGDVLVCTVEHLRHEISAVLQARRRADAEQAQAEQAQAQYQRWRVALLGGNTDAPDAPTILGGYRPPVPVPPAGPKPLPPTHTRPEYADAL